MDEANISLLAKFTEVVPQTFSVVNKLGENVDAYVKVNGEESFHGYTFVVKLYAMDKEIGVADFNIIDKGNYLFVTQVRNLTISNGVRGYSRVGTVLIDILKGIRTNLGYESIRLTARTPFNIPLPSKSNIRAFYRKMGFIETDSNGNDFMGYRMEYR